MFIFVGVKNLIEPASGRQDLQMNPTDSTATIAAKWAFDSRWSTTDFESVFLNPPGEWKAGDTQPGIGLREWVQDERSSSGESYVYVSPMDWANISQYGKHEGEAHNLVTEHWDIAQGLAKWQFYRFAGGGDTATIVTLSQRDYWK